MTGPCLPLAARITPVAGAGGGAVLGVQEAASSRLSPEEEPGTAAEAPGRQGIPTRKKTGSKT